MADSKYWRRPGRRDAERKALTRLMAKLERIRLRDGITKTAMATAIGVRKDVFFDWLSGRSLPSQKSVAKIEAFIKGRETEKASGIAPR
jgi:DNA-binding transcriptional regulator YiaG